MDKEGRPCRKGNWCLEKEVRAEEKDQIAEHTLGMQGAQVPYLHEPLNTVQNNHQTRSLGVAFEHH